jgi:hypothetical protein
MLKKLFLLVLLGVVLYSGVTVGMPWLRNYMFQKDIEELIREVGYNSIASVRGKVLLSARQNQIPIGEDALVTTRDEESGVVTIEARYTVTVKVGGEAYTKVWEFHPIATRVVTVAPGSGLAF